jgi:hypothetical protein
MTALNGNHGTLNYFALTGSSSNWIESYALIRPVPTQASNITTNSFTANWSAPTSGSAPTKYFLDVDDNSDFSSPLAGYNNLDVGNVFTFNVSGLSGSTMFYRLKAYRDSVTGGSQPQVT